MALKFDLNNASCLCICVPLHLLWTQTPDIKTKAGSVVEKSSTLPSVSRARVTDHHKGHSFKTATTNTKSSSCKPVHHKHTHQTCLCPQGSTLIISQSTGRSAKNIKTLGGPSHKNTAKICWLQPKCRPLVRCRTSLKGSQIWSTLHKIGLRCSQNARNMD